MYITLSILMFILSLITSGFLLYQGLKFHKLNKKLYSLNKKYEEMITDRQCYSPFILDVLQVQIGKSIIKLVEPLQENQLLPKMSELRHSLYERLGYIFPEVRIVDNQILQENEYRFFIRGRLVAKGFVYLDKNLVKFSDLKDKNISLYSHAIKEENIVLTEPMWWVDKAIANKNNISGLEPAEALIVHFKNCLDQNLEEVITLEYITQLLDAVKIKYPVCVNTLVPNLIDIVDLKIILINLLKENISIKNIHLILEKLCDYARLDKNLESLTRKIKAQLRKADTV